MGCCVLYFLNLWRLIVGLSRKYLVDPSLYDVNKPIAGIEDIHKYIPQRYEMEQLTAILYENPETNCAVGYKDITENEFWIRGHMPEFALMPGVVMCEVAGQLSSYYAVKNFDMGGTLGFAGFDSIRFRGMVVPGDRLIVQAKMLHARKKLITAEFMCLLDTTIVCQGIIKGGVLNVDLASLKK